MVLTAIDVDRFKILQVICHLVSGWSILFGISALIAHAGMEAFAFLLAGGILYTLGSILYAIGSRKQ